MAASLDAATRRSLLVLATGTAALALAALAEARIESGGQAGFGPWLYGAAVILFALGAFPRQALPAEDPRVAPGRRAVLLLAAPAFAAAVPSFLLLRRLGTQPERNEVALWLASLVLVLAAGLGGRRATAFPARWETRLPHSRAGRAAFAVAAIALLVAAAVARVAALGRIPIGINADEGDRAAVGIRMLRGDYPRRAFESGWYHVSNIYFWILARTMDVFGISVGGARMLGALCGVLIVGLVLFLALRHFGWRVALMAECFAAFCGVALQFSRETTEATPTAMLWTLSALFLLEAARAGPAWAWVGAGLAGGLSIYFYSPARLWPVLAAFFCIALFLQGPSAVRRRLAAGTVVAAFAAALAMAPFLLNSYRRGTFAIRARETSVFVAENRSRLPYMKKEWTLPRVLAAQVGRSFGIFGQVPDANYFWPSERPILPGALSVLTLLGLGSAALKARDPRMVLLTVWFGVGFVGMVVTVETPALQRMAGAVPVLSLFPALVLDDLVRRVASASGSNAVATRRALTAAATVASFGAIAFLVRKELTFYFEDYGARSETWSFPNGEGNTVAEQGTDSWVFTLGPHFHKISQGWVTFLAPDVPKAGLRLPGRDLPLAIPASRNLVFMVYPNQSDYLPWLQGLYPGGVLRIVRGRGGDVWFTTYRVPKAAWQATQGALAIYPDGRAVRVAHLGETPPASAEASRPIRWTAALRVGRSGNYAFLVGPGPATLEIDGSRIVSLAAGKAEGLEAVSLLRGDHAVTLEAGEKAHLEWSALASTLAGTPPSRWSPPSTAQLRPLATLPGGLLGVVTSAGRSGQRRLDGTIATADLAAQLAAAPPVDAVWTGTLMVRTPGIHRFAFRTADVDVDLSLDDRRIWSEGESPEVLIWRDAMLEAGPHAVRVSVHVKQAPGQVEWVWAPPGEAPSIVPASVLAPPPGSGVGRETPADATGGGESAPRDRAFTPQR